MPVAISANYMAMLRKGDNTPVIVIEVALDSGTIKLGTHLIGSDVRPVLGAVSSLQCKIDPEAGFTTLGQMTFEIKGRENFRSLIQNNYLKNRRVTRKNGFVGLAYGDFTSPYTGKIKGLKRKGDVLTVTVEDDLSDTDKNIPVENTSDTQYLDYRNTHPVDIMTNILLTQIGIDAAYVDSTQFTTERDLWLNGWKYERVLTESQSALEYLKELQRETNSFIFHDGAKISFKVFAPPVTGQTVEEWSDANHILAGTLECAGGYDDNFYNRIVIRYDYDESGSDGDENFESVYIAADSDSQGSSQWNEVSTKEIKSKWIRTRTYAQPANITGVKLYYVSKNNGTGTGTLTYNNTNKTLQWTPPGGSIGEAVEVTEDGKFEVYGSDGTKLVRAIVTYASLPGSDQTDSIGITALLGDNYAAWLAAKYLNRYRDPASSVTFKVGLNNIGWSGYYLKPTDIKDLTTDEAFEKGDSTWNKERVMITKVRPDAQKKVIELEAIETRQYRRYGFIAPAGYPDYASATSEQRERAFIGRASDNKVYDGSAYVAGYYIW